MAKCKPGTHQSCRHVPTSMSLDDPMSPQGTVWRQRNRLQASAMQNKNTAMKRVQAYAFEKRTHAVQSNYENALTRSQREPERPLRNQEYVVHQITNSNTHTHYTHIYSKDAYHKRMQLLGDTVGPAHDRNHTHLKRHLVKQTKLYNACKKKILP